MLSAATASSTHITSRQNPIVARYRAVAQGDSDGLLLLDGVHLVNDAVAAGVAIEHAAVDVNASGRHEVARLLASLRARGIDTVTATAPVMGALSPVRSSRASTAAASLRRSRAAARRCSKWICCNQPRC